MKENQLSGKYGQAKLMVPTSTLEQSCVRQIKTFLDHPAFTNPVAIMADTHAGAGAVIGFTMKMTEKVIPNVIGVDIGCGMVSLNLGPKLSVAHDKVDAYIREHVPFGFHQHATPMHGPEEAFPWDALNERAEEVASRLEAELGLKITPPSYSPAWLEDKARQLRTTRGAVLASLGTLGGGNHFIEIGESEKSGDFWATIHTGSRNFGKRVADYWQRRAADFLGGNHREAWSRKVEEIKAKVPAGKALGEALNTAREAHLEAGAGIPKGLEWLAPEDLPGYLFDMLFAQAYAAANRETIAQILVKAFGVEPGDRIESTHNFIDFDDFMIRKGAIRAYKGERMIIPFNMRDGVLLCEGRSASEWNCSAPHGAGRVMSRSEARRSLKVEDFVAEMDGVFSTTVDASTLDEAPGAYKDAAMIERAIEGTAQVIDRLRPVHNLKAGEGDQQ